MLGEILSTRKLGKSDPVPYDLLLLADEEIQAIDRYINRSDIYVTELEGRVVGVYVLCPIDNEIVEIKAIAVSEPYQDRGIGKFMLRDAEIKSRESGYIKLIIGTPSIARKQLSIYQKAGFTLYEIRKDFFIEYYSKPIFEDGVQLRDMAMLVKDLLNGK